VNGSGILGAKSYTDLVPKGKTIIDIDIPTDYCMDVSIPHFTAQIRAELEKVSEKLNQLLSSGIAPRASASKDGI